MGGAAASAPRGMGGSLDRTAGRGCDGAQPPRSWNGGRRSVGAEGGMEVSRDRTAGRGCDGAQPPRSWNGGRRSVGAEGHGRQPGSNRRSRLRRSAAPQIMEWGAPLRRRRGAWKGAWIEPPAAAATERSPPNHEMGGAAPSAPKGMEVSLDRTAGRGCDGAQPPRSWRGMDGGRRSVGAGGHEREQAWICRDAAATERSPPGMGRSHGWGAPLRRRRKPGKRAGTDPPGAAATERSPPGMGRSHGWGAPLRRRRRA
jgi:hypothetical protein